jgi:hypothetical protein
MDLTILSALMYFGYFPRVEMLRLVYYYYYPGKVGGAVEERPREKWATQLRFLLSSS